MSDGKPILVKAVVLTDNPSHAARAAEVIARAASGLALEGLFISMSIGRGSDDDLIDNEDKIEGRED